MNIIDQMAEAYIQEAIDRGDLDDLQELGNRYPWRMIRWFPQSSEPLIDC